MSAIFDQLATTNHEAVLFCQDQATGLKGFIALHNTVLGPGLGGCRMMVYPNEAAALTDALQLSQAMTYKNALAGLDYGGGKGVIWLENPAQKTPALVQAMGKRIGLLNGRYYTATDIGSTSDDMWLMRQETPYVSALTPEHGGLGDSATLTGYGVYKGMLAAVKHAMGRNDLGGLKIALQGTGKVAFHLAQYLVAEGCDLVVSDPYDGALAKFTAAYPTAQVVSQDVIFDQPVDILSPNAIGGMITQAVAESTQAKLIVGGANNPLSSPAIADVLHNRGIWFAPDFAVNSGGVILLAAELAGQTVEEAKIQTAGIYDTLLKVFAYSETHSVNPLQAAISLAQQRIAAKTI
jgi:valine dehydrogenase (NAD+)